MSNSINLIKKQTEVNNKTDISNKIKKISFIVLICLGLLSIVLFLLSYRFSIGYVRSQEDKLIRKLGTYEQLGSKVYLLNSRLSDISLLISGRSNFNQITDSIVNVMPANLKFTKYQIDAGGIMIEANSKNLSDINDFLNSLLDLNSNKMLTSVEITSLSANALGYSIKLSLH